MCVGRGPTRLALSTPAVRSSKRTVVGAPVRTDLLAHASAGRWTSLCRARISACAKRRGGEEGAHSFTLWFQTGAVVPRFALRVRSSTPP